MAFEWDARGEGEKGGDAFGGEVPECASWLEGEAAEEQMFWMVAYVEGEGMQEEVVGAAEVVDSHRKGARQHHSDAMNVHMHAFAHACVEYVQQVLMRRDSDARPDIEVSPAGHGVVCLVADGRLCALAKVCLVCCVFSCTMCRPQCLGSGVFSKAWPC